MTQFQSLFLICTAVSLFAPLRPSFRLMSAAGLIGIAAQGTAVGAIACAISAAAATVDICVLVRLAYRGIRS